VDPGDGCCCCLVLLVNREPQTCWRCLALALFVAQVFANHHDPTVAADHLALVADLLDAWLDLHRPAVCEKWIVGGNAARLDYR
jgi:hypothetical protein